MLRNCENCNRVFAHPTRLLCDACYQEEQDDFTAVKEYLRENPKATIGEVAEKTEVDLETIYKFIRQERLDIIPSDIKFHCEICGAEIEGGRVCSKCRAEFRKTKESGEKPAEETVRERSRIRYLDQIRRKR
ncbi:MAG TPA: MerR family transcriptional regulator [Firmicutes bacterium]|nr:MerR family transcriptional regulator [Bacillota bacterium]